MTNNHNSCIVAIDMTTLRHMAGLWSGLYRETTSGESYLQDDLLDRMPDDVLARPVRIEREERGVYRISVGNGTGPVFMLWSRRQRPRVEPGEQQPLPAI
jgi:hypothetical protein